MTWNDEIKQGFAMTAVALDDIGAELAAKGLTPVAAEQLCQVAKKLAALPAAKRREEIQRISELFHPSLPENPAISPRARSLLATSVPHEIAAKWLANAPAPRPGYRPSKALKSIIRQVVLMSRNKKKRKL